MMKSKIFFLTLLISNFYFQVSTAQVKVAKFDSVKSLLENKSDSTIILNFWATWCKPCVTELPYFEELKKKHAAEKIKIVLISLDFKRDMETRLKPFVEKNKIACQVLLLDDANYNSWIDKVDSTWSGALPATIVISSGKKTFYEKEFTSYLDLEKIITLTK